jgi:single-strand DNA-binding protein
MIFATVTGRLTKDAELRQAGSGSVCGMSIASNKKVKSEDVATFVDASLWGKRGEAIVQYLKKGTRVTAVGELGTREHNGKTYLTLNVSEIDFSSAGGQRAEPPAPKPGPASSGGGFSDEDYGNKPIDDDPIPFVVNVTTEPSERWWRKNQ